MWAVKLATQNDRTSNMRVFVQYFLLISVGPDVPIGEGRGAVEREVEVRVRQRVFALDHLTSMKITTRMLLCY